MTKALLFAGTHSGSGKTTITLGVMAALKKLGHTVMPFKCGPDFIDPTLHTMVTGQTSRNLDLWMAGESFSRQCFAQHSERADISVIEGVMGMFDGGKSSSASLAAALRVPVILILDARSAAESVAAVLKGFETLMPEVAPRGVIINMIGSERHFELVKDAITKHCQAEILGYIPRTLEFKLPSRHLGLHMGEEQPLSRESINLLAETIVTHIDIDRMLALAESNTTSPRIRENGQQKPIIRLGVARDKAFCFYYQDNLDIFHQAGAEICFFSPLQDKHLPENLDGIYLGGGYPELYGEQLSANFTMLEDIRNWAEDNRPLYAECGGFMYLTQGITDLDNHFHSLAGIFPTTAVMQTRRSSLGYRELNTNRESFFGPNGTQLRGHEFHYSRIEPLDSAIERIYDVNGGTAEGYRYKNCVGGYMHLHFGSNREAACNFIDFCKG